MVHEVAPIFGVSPFPYVEGTPVVRGLVELVKPF